MVARPAKSDLTSYAISSKELPGYINVTGCVDRHLRTLHEQTWDGSRAAKRVEDHWSAPGGAAVCGPHQLYGDPREAIGRTAHARGIEVGVGNIDPERVGRINRHPVLIKQVSQAILGHCLHWVSEGLSAVGRF